MVVVAGMAALLRYEMTPGPAGGSPPHWPAGTTLLPARDRATLVMLLHPRCPCSTATLAELSGLLTRCHDLVEARLLFVMPSDGGPEWTASDLVQDARRLPGVQVHLDTGGREAARFGAATSGHVLVYDTTGHLAFSGGITASRGHQGDNHGRAAIEALLTGEQGSSLSTPVFGCLLSSPCQPPAVAAAL